MSTCGATRRHGEKCVIVIIDLAPVRDGTGSARLLDMIPGRSKQAFKAWLAAQPAAFRDRLEVIAMDGFAAFMTATTEELPDAVAVMDPFHVARLAGDALDRCRRRIQQDLHGHRGCKKTCSSPPDAPCTPARTCSPTAGAPDWTALFADPAHIAVEATWGVYQAVIAAYRHPDRTQGHAIMTEVIDSLSRGVPAALSEVTTLGRTLKKRSAARIGDSG